MKSNWSEKIDNKDKIWTLELLRQGEIEWSNHFYEKDKKKYRNLLIRINERIKEYDTEIEELSVNNQ